MEANRFGPTLIIVLLFLPLSVFGQSLVAVVDYMKLTPGEEENYVEGIAIR
jgi:hypothetical protein